MKALINQNFDTKLHLYGTKFFSAIDSLQTTSISPAKPHTPSNFSTTFDPYQILNSATKSRGQTLIETKIIHSLFLKTSTFDSNVEFSNFLLRSYGESSGHVYAFKLFDTIPHPDTGSWNLIISCFNRNLLYDDSWRTFCRMHSSGFGPNEFTYGSVLSACNALQFVNHGKLLYALAFKHGYSLDGYVRSGMIDLFIKSCRFDDALKVFYDEYCGNVVCWNAIISGAIKHNEDAIGLNLFRQMSRGFPPPNKFTFPSVLTACAKLENLELGRGVHGMVVKYGEEEDVFVGTAIVDFYTKCGHVSEAVKKFSQMSIRNVVSWTAIITGYVQKGDFYAALMLFKDMIISKEEINSYTVTSVLSACANPLMVKEAFQIHGWIYKTGLYSNSTVKNSLINLYSKTGEMKLSQEIFREAKDLMNISTWAAMITAFSQNGTLEKAFGLLKKMFHEGVKPDKSCIPSVLSITDCLELGQQIHCYTLKTGTSFDLVVGSSLFTMYSKCGNLKDSYEIFKQIPEKDGVSWASMVAGFAEHECPYQAIELFKEMLSQNVVLDETTINSVFATCSSPRFLKIGKEIHCFTIRNQVNKAIYGGNAVVNMYSRCGDLNLARKVFDFMPFKDQISCSALVSGYAQNGYIEEALHLFIELLASSLEIDSFTLSSVLGVVGDFNKSNIGGQLHALIIKLGFESETSVGSSLVTMYARCGTIDDCRKAFDKIKKPDLISWTTMISSYGQHGKGQEALKVFEFMRKSGVKPDSVTFVGLLTACSHCGLIEEAYYYLNSMVKDYGIRPSQRHYACMVDLLGRAGRLEEAERFIEGMPIEADMVVWGTLMAACGVHREVEIGKRAADKFMEIEPAADGAYVALSNICADVGQWEEVLKIRNEMKGSGVNKQTGWSYV